MPSFNGMTLARFGWKITSCLVVLIWATACLIYEARKVEAIKAFLLRNLCPSKKPKSRKMEEAAITSVIQKLDNCQTDEEMKRVMIEMKVILNIMRKKNLGGGRRLSLLVSDLVHMAEDALYLYNKYRERSTSLPGKMESIHRWIEEIKKRMLKLGVDEVETRELSNIRRSKNDGERDDDEYVVGLENDVEMLLQMLFRRKVIAGQEYLSPILIKGMSGIGKTTLARQLYNHAVVVDQFERRAWVCVTNLTLKEILIKLIQQVEVVVDGENPHTSLSLEGMDNRSLLDMLCCHLKGKQYLIVLDDVPRQIYLRCVWEALPKEYNGSKLLLTSHMTYQISYFTKADVHRMEPLNPNKSWQLFFKTINSGYKLTSEHKFPKYLEQRAKHMLISKCGGLPLAIKEVGKQLAEKKVSERSDHEWEQLLESVDFSSTLELLEPFYEKLDPKVKSCFLYMAFYKENTTLRVKKLIQIWIAGGLLSSNNHMSYVDCLSNESVIEVQDKRTLYRMNPVLHRLSIKKAEEEIGFEILSINGNNQLLQNPSHRVIICSRDKFNYSTNQDKHLVSLFFHGGGYFDASPSYWKSFELLKTLDLEDFGIKILPESIGTLMELRYLGLRNNYIQELPRSLGCLKSLEVLDIAQNFTVEVPGIIWEMDSLRHLYMSDVIFREPFQINALRNLETLTYVSVDNWTYELRRLVYGLKKLGIEELGENSDVGKLFASLNMLLFLNHLILRGCCFRSMPCLDKLGILDGLHTLKLDGRLRRLPNSFPRRLDSLTLVNSCLDEDPMPLLGQIRALHYLKLHNAYTGQQMVIMDGGFASLEVLCIEELRNLRNVQLVKGGMPDLKKLEIKKCPYLDTLPEAIVSIYYLKELKMVTTKDIATKIRNSDLISKIEHVSINP